MSGLWSAEVNTKQRRAISMHFFQCIFLRPTSRCLSSCAPPLQLGVVALPLFDQIHCMVGYPFFPLCQLIMFRCQCCWMLKSWISFHLAFAVRSSPMAATFSCIVYLKRFAISAILRCSVLLFGSGYCLYDRLLHFLSINAI